MSRVRIGIGKNFALDQFAPNLRDKPGTSRRMNASFTGSEHNARPTSFPDPALFFRQMPDVFGKKIHLHARWSCALALAAARHWAIIRRLWHCCEHRFVGFGRENALEFEVEKWFVHSTGLVD